MYRDAAGLSHKTGSANTAELNNRDHSRGGSRLHHTLGHHGHHGHDGGMIGSHIISSIEVDKAALHDLKSDGVENGGEDLKLPMTSANMMGE